MRWWVVVFCVLGTTLLSCTGSGGDGEREVRRADADRTRPVSAPGPERTFSALALWTDPAAHVQIIDTCYKGINASSEGRRRFCTEQLMQQQGASPEAIHFFLETEHWLTGLAYSPGKIKAGRVLNPNNPLALPQLVFLQGDPALQQLSDLFDNAFPRQDDRGPWPFERDPLYPRLLAAAEQKFRNADEPLLLRHFNLAELESHTEAAAGRQVFVVQIGIHNFCEACGVGVAARYSLAFDGNGHLAEAQFLSLCQGREVTRNIEGIGSATFREFSGLKKAPERIGGIQEPYLLVVPGLVTCPAHVEF